MFIMPPRLTRMLLWADADVAAYGVEDAQADDDNDDDDDGEAEVKEVWMVRM